MKNYVFLESEKYGVIRAIHTDDGLLLCASDVARALGYKKPSNAVRDHCINVVKREFPTNGGAQLMSFITEAEAWCFCSLCNRPGAEELTEYLFDVAIPFASQRLAGVTVENDEPDDEPAFDFGVDPADEAAVVSYTDKLTDIGAKAGALVFAKAMIEQIIAVLSDKFGFPFDDVLAAASAVAEVEPGAAAMEDEREKYLNDVLGALFGEMV